MQASPVSPGPLMELSTGFWASKTLAAAHELGLFAMLAEAGGTTPDELAVRAGIEGRPAAMLLTACASLGLLEKTGDRYRNTALADTYLVPGQPYYFGGWLQMLDRRLYPGWANLTKAIRTNRPTTWNPDEQESLFEGEDPELLAVFWDAMHSLSIFTARALGAAVDLTGRRRLLDVGGGSGAYDIELCKLCPELNATVYDLPFVVEIAAKKVADAGLSDRIGTAGGDFFRDATLPEGHDCILLSMILHDWNEDHDRDILARCFDALPSGGLIVISELLVNDEKTGPAPAALMSLNMLIETEGCNYTAREYATWLEDVGFQGVRTTYFDAPGANGAVCAIKP